MSSEECPRPTVDAIIEMDNKIVLIKRGVEPFKDMWALPGGHVKVKETVEDAIVREVKEETSLDIRLEEILGVYSDPGRDPRNTITTVFIAKPTFGELKAGTDASEAKWMELNKINFKELAFDHGKILNDYKKWKERKRTFWSSK